MMLHHDDDAIDEFPIRLAKLRQWRELSQADVAHATGLHPSQVSHFETGTRGPSLPNLVRIVRLLGSPGYLFGLQSLPDSAKGGA
jgi:transcriptional regulator with XRE-family HTH domain